MIPMDAFDSGSWQRKPDIRNVISGVFFSRCMEFRQRILNGLSGFRSCCMSKIKCRRESGWMHWRSSAAIMTKHI